MYYKEVAYEIFRRTTARVETPALALTIDGRMALNAAAVRVFVSSGIASVLLLWDKANNRLALKAAQKNDKNSYAVSMGRDSHSGSLRAKAFLSHIGWKAPKRLLLPAVWNEKERMLEVDLPAEYLGRPRA